MGDGFAHLAHRQRAAGRGLDQVENGGIGDGASFALGADLIDDRRGRARALGRGPRRREQQGRQDRGRTDHQKARLIRTSSA